MFLFQSLVFYPSTPTIHFYPQVFFSCIWSHEKKATNETSVLKKREREIRLNKKNKIQYVAADIKEILLIDCHGLFGFNFFITAVCIDNLYVCHSRKPPERSQRLSLHWCDHQENASFNKNTFCSFTEVRDGPFTMAFFLGCKNNFVIKLDGGHEVGFGLHFGIDKRRGKSEMVARIL